MRALTLKLCAFRFFDTFLLIVPFYTVMFAERGLTPTQIAIALAAWSATAVVLEAPAGVLADRWSRRGLLFIGQTLRAVGFAIWIVAPGFEGYLVGLMLWGLKTALMSGTFEALAYDELAALGRQDAYARTIGRAHAARWAGFVSASLLAAVMIRFGYDVLLMATVGAAVLSAGAALALPPARRTLARHPHSYLGHLRQGFADARRIPGVTPLLISIAAMQGIVTACEDYWQLFGKGVGLSPPRIALFVAGIGAISVVATALAHRAQGLSLRTLYGLLALTGVMLTAAAALYRPASIFLLIPYFALIRTLEINLDAQFQHRIVPETRATVASVKGLAAQCANTVLILSFGLVAQAGDYSAAFVTYGVALSLLGAVYALRGPRWITARPTPS
jgi:predicted MFS family arabinose efflux permease